MVLDILVSPGKRSVFRGWDSVHVIYLMPDVPVVG